VELATRAIPLKEADHLMKHHPAEGLPAGLEALSSLVVGVLDAYTEAAGLCAVCEAAWPCELVLLADHNYDLATL
jgi:hypothetical protein